MVVILAACLFTLPPPSHTHIHTRSSDLYVYAMFLSKGKIDEYEIHEKKDKEAP